MSDIVACVDGSPHADGVCALAAWASEQTSAMVQLLHVITPESEATTTAELSGSIGLGAKSALLEELAKVDEERGRLEQKKGQLMLHHAQEELERRGITDFKTIHRRGSLVDTLSDIVPQDAATSLIIMGRRGEQEAAAQQHLGSNLERVARSLHTPLLVTRRDPAIPRERFLIAYDGSESAEKAVRFAETSPLLKGMTCHVLYAGSNTPAHFRMLEQVEERLQQAGYSVEVVLRQTQQIEASILDYINGHDLELLLMGAYGHSRLRSLFLGSTTGAIIRATAVPVMLFR